MSTALATALAHPVAYGWWWPGPWFLLIPLFWFLVVVGFIVFFATRRLRWAAAGYGYGPCGPWSRAAGRSSATSVLAERFARGEIDEAEYRARLETLLATEQRPQP